MKKKCKACGGLLIVPDNDPAAPDYCFKCNVPHANDRNYRNILTQKTFKEKEITKDAEDDEVRPTTKMPHIKKKEISRDKFRGHRK